MAVRKGALHPGVREVAAGQPVDQARRESAGLNILVLAVTEGFPLIAGELPTSLQQLLDGLQGTVVPGNGVPHRRENVDRDLDGLGRRLEHLPADARPLGNARFSAHIKHFHGGHVGAGGAGGEDEGGQIE